MRFAKLGEGRHVFKMRISHMGSSLGKSVGGDEKE